MLTLSLDQIAEGRLIAIEGGPLAQKFQGIIWTIPTPAVYTALYGTSHADPLAIIGDYETAQFTTDSCLVRGPTFEPGGGIYLVTHAKKWHILSPDTVVKYHFDTNQAAIVPLGALHAMNNGPDIG